MSLVGFVARNHPQQAVRDAVDDRRTPRDLFDGLNAVHRFTLDVAASDENALCPLYFTRDTDGLLLPWTGERVWCNPPYSRLEPWLAKAWHEMGGGCDAIVMLLPANRAEQPWWHRWVEPCRDGRPSLVEGVRLTTRFVAKRLRFQTKGGVEFKKNTRNSGPPFGCVLLTWERS